MMSVPMGGNAPAESMPVPRYRNRLTRAVRQHLTQSVMSDVVGAIWSPWRLLRQFPWVKGNRLSEVEEATILYSELVVCTADQVSPAGGIPPAPNGTELAQLYPCPSLKQGPGRSQE